MPTKGFTLIELLIVIAILSLLTTLGVANFRTTRIKARDLERKSDLQTISKSLEAYVNDHRQYPLSNNGLIVCQSDGTTCAWGSAFSDGLTTYLPALPEEGNSGLTYFYVSADGQSYSLYAQLENPNDPQLTTFDPPVYCGGSNLCNYKISSSNLP